MKNISDHFKEYAFLKNVYKGGRPATSGKKTFKLSSNENALGSPQLVKEVFQNVKRVHIYPDNTDQRLREKLRLHHGEQLGIDQFICGNSGSEILELAIRAFVNLGDEVIISSPCFLPYQSFSEKFGGIVIDVPLTSKAYQLDTLGILNAINNKTRIIFLTSPNNPTGTYIPKSILDNLFSKIPKNILIIYDEVYYQYADAIDYSTAMPWVKKGYNLLAINSFSKAYGMAGLRLGYGYSNAKIANYIRQFQRPFLINRLALDAGVAALSDHFFIQKTIQHNLKEKIYLEKEFQKLNIKYTPSQGNFHLIDPPFPSDQLVALLHEQGIMVRDVGNFGALGKIRITIGTHEANQALIQALKTILKHSK